MDNLDVSSFSTVVRSPEVSLATCGFPREITSSLRGRRGDTAIINTPSASFKEEVLMPTVHLAPTWAAAMPATAIAAADLAQDQYKAGQASGWGGSR